MTDTYSSERLTALAYLEAAFTSRTDDMQSIADADSDGLLARGLVYFAALTIGLLADQASVSNAEIIRQLRVLAIAEQIADGIA